MVNVTPELLNDMATAIVREVDPERVILFGSMARGEQQTSSDVDFLVVEDAPFGTHRSRRKELRRIRQALSRFPVPKDVLVYSTAEFERWRSTTNHVVAQSVREGRVLYERR